MNYGTKINFEILLVSHVIPNNLVEKFISKNLIPGSQRQNESLINLNQA